MNRSLRRALLDWLDDHKAEMLDLLEAAVNIDSGSHDKAGVDRVNALFRAHLDAAGIATEVHPMEHHGDCLSAHIPGSQADAARYVLLLGHMDTVFPAGTARQRPVRNSRNGGMQRPIAGGIAQA